jgi:hypothetical protein
VANLPVDQFYPQKQAGEFGDTSIVVPSSAWPPKGELKFDTTAAELPMDMSVFTHVSTMQYNGTGMFILMFTIVNS